MSYNATRLRILELVNTQVPYDKGYLRVNNDIILNTGNEGVINAGYDGHSQLLNSLLYEADYQLNYVESFNNSLAITSYGETVLVSGSDGLNNMYYETNYIKGEDIWDTFNDNNFYISGIAEVELLESVNGISNIYFDYHYIKGIDITDDFINNNLYLNNSGDINIIEGDNISGNLSNTIFMPSDQSQDEIISVDNKYIYFSGVVEGVYVNSDNGLGNFDTSIIADLFRNVEIYQNITVNANMVNTADGVLVAGNDGRNKISMTVIANITANTGEIRLRWAYLSKSLDPFCVAYPEAIIGTKCTIKDQIMTISGSNDGFSGCINIKCVEY